MIDKAWSEFKGLVLLKDRVDRLAANVETLSGQIVDHEHRLIRIEALIEYSGGGRPQARPRRVKPPE